MKKISTITYHWETHHNLLAGLGIILAVMLMLTIYSCGGGTTTETTQEEQATEKKENVISFTDEDIQALKDKFIFDETTGYFYHKHWNRTWPKRRTLTADVMKNGYYFLSSNFYGNKGINHSKVIVKIGEEEMETEEVDLKNESEHRTEKADNGYVFEINYYTKYRDKGIFDAIGKSTGPVMVSFVGKRSSTEFEEVPKSDVEALRDCYQLSLVQRATGGQ
ncbi:MAG: hypothetical protein D6730_22330 [Bacteroidetes bacterium]|nr:MAG: hypothetical protein D6730_22330 [Bacteroidota bacterium]